MATPADADNGNPTRDSRDEPLYNIGVVERMTGVPVATIRAWERRYGFPTAQRTEGGHRIYSEREVARLRWVKARVDDGMQASKAVHALEVAEEQGRVPTLPGEMTADDQQDGAGPSSSLDTIHRRFTEALLRHDTDGATQLLAEGISVFSVEQLMLEVMRPALVDIGEGWAAGRVSVATEHLASQFVRQRLMQWMLAGPSTYAVRPIVLACAPDEWHDLSLLMLGVLARRRRWPVHYLGQSVPLPDLARFVDHTRPPAVVLSAMREETARAIAAWPEHLSGAAEEGRPPICFGGLAFAQWPDLRDLVPGTYLGATLDDAADRLDQVLRETTGIVT